MKCKQPPQGPGDRKKIKIKKEFEKREKGERNSSSGFCRKSL